MIAKSQITPIDNKGVQTFTMKETLKLPMIVKDPRHDGQTTTFMKNGQVKGQIVHAKVAAKTKKGDFQPIVDGKALGVMSEGGYYLVPIDKITWNSDTWNEAEGTEHTEDGRIVVSEELEQLPATVVAAVQSDKTILGFTYKQLLLVAGIVFIVNKFTK